MPVAVTVTVTVAMAVTVSVTLPRINVKAFFGIEGAQSFFVKMKCHDNFS